MAPHPNLLSMRHIRLSKTAINAIGKAVDHIFDRAIARFLGPGATDKAGKELAFKFQPNISLTSLFTQASKLEDAEPREEVLRSLIKIAQAYLNAQRERAKARISQEVQGFLVDAQTKGVKTDVQTVLGGKLSELMADIKSDVKTIVTTEANNTANTSIFDAVGRVGASVGIDDPTVFFVCVHDKHLCDECKRLHLMDDEITPRCWKMSELGAGYHKKGDKTPKVSGLHPNCRCSLTHLLPGFSFDASGHVTFKETGWDELAHQRK